jgi:hypothetical protein
VPKSGYVTVTLVPTAGEHSESGAEAQLLVRTT